MPIRLLILILLGSVGLIDLGAQAPNIKVYHEQVSTEQLIIYADNPEAIPVHATITFPVLENLSVDPPPPLAIQLAAKTSKQMLASLKALGSGETKLKYRHYSSWGDPHAHHDDTVVYLFPFAHGSKFKVVQGNHGKFSHRGQNEYGFDFNLPEGTPVHAAREGIVAQIAQAGNRGGTVPEFEALTNYILIYHADGSFGNYAHLRQNGAAVTIGQTVKAGQLIGYSGNTGYSSGPHLHFDVRMPQPDGNMTSIPIRFRAPDGQPVVPHEGTYHYAAIPGQPAFAMLLGTDLGNDRYNNYAKSLPAGKNVGARSERLDDTFVIFFRNETDQTVRLQYRFRLKNLVSSTNTEGSIEIPGRTELFGAILRPDRLGLPFSYDCDYSSQPIN